MSTDAYALIDSENTVVDMIMADDIETARHFLNGNVVKVVDWASIGWVYDPETNLFSEKAD